MAAAACATSAGQSVAGAADQTARGLPPVARCRRKAGPGWWSTHAASPAAASWDQGPAGADGSFSVVAWRCGTASRSTSERVPAYLSASAPARVAICGCRTGSGLTTRRNGASRPVWSLSAARASTKPSTSCPAKRTFTRAPGTAVSAIATGTV